MAEIENLIEQGLPQASSWPPCLCSHISESPGSLLTRQVLSCDEHEGYLLSQLSRASLRDRNSEKSSLRGAHTRGADYTLASTVWSPETLYLRTMRQIREDHCLARETGKLENMTHASTEITASIY